ncbi:Tubulin_tyrosine ligase [Hexamita inflata]|uniref:Tubulin--tyrosine ligase-like protein 9 n=1 Tax=Hexamita inflata TaxID=28002 RepID=A0AA86U365_9EUKA|nr:Tubulin tyrosine ligase [Hexamita inflata]
MKFWTVSKFNTPIYKVLSRFGDESVGNDFDFVWASRIEIYPFTKLQELIESHQQQTVSQNINANKPNQTIGFNDFYINHFTDHLELTQKDLFAANMQRFEKSHISKTLIAPEQINQFAEFEDECEQRWIAKPASLYHGKGIFIGTKAEIIEFLSHIQYKVNPNQIEGEFDLFHHLGLEIDKNELIQRAQIAQKYVIQKYIEPLLINKHKFDLRLYVLVREFQPEVKAYICNEGFARFALNRYDHEHLESQLTNIAIQKNNDNYDASLDGAKLDACSLFQILKMRLGKQKTRQIQLDIEKAIFDSLNHVADKIFNHPRQFEIYGYDVLIGQDLQVYICEVNACPNMSSDTEDDKIIKERMLSDALRMVLDDLDIKESYGCFHKLGIESNILIGDKVDRAQALF